MLEYPSEDLVASKNNSEKVPMGDFRYNRSAGHVVDYLLFKARKVQVNLSTSYMYIAASSHAT